MQNLVVDSSVIIKWLNRNQEKNIDKADQILNDARNGKVEIFTPELAKYEIGNALLMGKKLTPGEAYVSLATVYALPLNFICESPGGAKETYSIATKYRTTYYDAAFLSLAKQYGAILITENIKHQGKVKDVKVVALKDY